MSKLSPDPISLSDLSAEDTYILDAFRQLSPRDRRVVLDLARHMADAERKYSPAGGDDEQR